jgi:predicted Zn-dependent protease
VVAWTGTVPGTATTAIGSSELSKLTLSKELLDAAESWALALLTAREVPRGPSNLLLTPAVAALLIGGCLVPCLDASDWPIGDRALADSSRRDLGSPLLTIIDDPRGRHYGSRHFDDDGRVTEPIVLLEGGRITGGLGRGRTHKARRHLLPAEGWVGSPTRIRVSPGQKSLQGLLGDLGEGIVLEGPIAAEIDRATLDFNLRVSRGLGVSKGTLSGRLYGSLAVRGNLLDVLGQTRALSADSTVLPLGASADFPHPFSVSAPALSTVGYVEPG